MHTHSYNISLIDKCVGLFVDMTCNVKKDSAVQYVLTLLSDLTEVMNLLMCCCIYLRFLRIHTLLVC